MNAPTSPSPYSVEDFLESWKRRPSLPGDWINVKIIDENDDEIELECRVTVTEERDPYGTGDSPTEYPVEIHQVLHNDVDWDLSREQELIVIHNAVRLLK